MCLAFYSGIPRSLLSYQGLSLFPVPPPCFTSSPRPFPPQTLPQSHTPDSLLKQ